MTTPKEKLPWRDRAVIKAADLLYDACKAIDNSEWKGDWAIQVANELFRVSTKVRAKSKSSFRRLRILFFVGPGTVSVAAPEEGGVYERVGEGEWKFYAYAPKRASLQIRDRRRAERKP